MNKFNSFLPGTLSIPAFDHQRNIENSFVLKLLTIKTFIVTAFYRYRLQVTAIPSTAKQSL